MPDYGGRRKPIIIMDHELCRGVLASFFSPARIDFVVASAGKATLACLLHSMLTTLAAANANQQWRCGGADDEVLI